MQSTALVWFRNDLRMTDNHSLHQATFKNDRVIAVFFFDPRLFEKDRFGFKKTERFRAKFLIESITELKENLQKLNISLLVYHDKPEGVLPKLIDNYKINNIYLQKEWTEEEFSVLEKTKEATSKLNLNWFEMYDQFMFHPDDIPFNFEEIPQVFTNFRKKCEKLAAVRPEVNAKKMFSENLITNSTQVPTLSDLYFESFEMDSRTAFPFRGGENQALQRVNDYFWNTKRLSYYKKTRNGLVGENYSSKFSAWLANGCISPRTIYHKLKAYEKQIEKNQSTYWLFFELIWRDFFKYVSLKHGSNLFKLRGILKKDYAWSYDDEKIKDWTMGETNEPFVNANMIELKNTGWMSNRGRQNVASYFSKELELDWRIGAAYFESLLIDYDVHSNYGNWQYVAGVGNDPRDRKFNIRMQAERYDPNQKFQNLWLQPTLF
ncbi:DASH family cryptochrome [Aquimarina sp. SS2-1]|uniref:DASH family cryptochrome n=1 Tax=Aquimarina besae TaxID=3342247 RepID=UPI0036733225